jgi:hypothetical protein
LTSRLREGKIAARVVRRHGDVRDDVHAAGDSDDDAHADDGVGLTVMAGIERESSRSSELVPTPDRSLHSVDSAAPPAGVHP